MLKVCFVFSKGSHKFPPWLFLHQVWHNRIIFVLAKGGRSTQIQTPWKTPGSLWSTVPKNRRKAWVKHHGNVRRTKISRGMDKKIRITGIGEAWNHPLIFGKRQDDLDGYNYDYNLVVCCECWVILGITWWSVGDNHHSTSTMRLND